MKNPRILKDNKSFRAYYHELQKGDVIIGLLNLKPTEESVFLDLSERGIRLFPSALSQKLSRSKCLQAIVYKKWMVPNTTVIRDRHDMIRATNHLSGQGPMITKQNRMNCGLGIHLWNDVESVYNQACFGNLQYPFVIQPFVPDVLDVRVIILGDYIEAYWRKNRRSFRNNIFFGGESGPFKLTEKDIELCQDVMERGKFPYAHIDLMLTRDPPRRFLSEINLRGGLKGASISHEDYQSRIRRLEEAFEQDIAQELTENM